MSKAKRIPWHQKFRRQLYHQNYGRLLKWEQEKDEFSKKLETQMIVSIKNSENFK